VTIGYRNGVLHAGGVPLDALARHYGTPLYVYDAATVRDRAARFRSAFRDLPVTLCYAVKANPHLAILRIFADAGFGADTVSGGEIRRALAAGIDPAGIVFAGVGKSDEEIRLALEAGIGQFNVESLGELRRIHELAAEGGFVAPVAVRLNPDVDAGTHDKITTGRRRDKFGMSPETARYALRLAEALPHLEPVGVHVHIGSQIIDLAVLETAWQRALAFVDEARAAGIDLRRVDLGGGFAVRYRDERPPSPEAVADLLARLLRGRDLQVILEPGRALVAEAGVLVVRVLDRKEEDGGRRFLVVDAGMNVLLRPALYDAWHDIEPVYEPPAGTARARFDVVGPICESADVLGRDRELPPLARGDLLAVRTVGAYGAVMVSDYNARPRPAEVLVDGTRVALITPRIEPEEGMRRERVPEWLHPAGDGGGGTDGPKSGR